MRRFNWPFMLRSTHEAVRRENVFLRDALNEANKEIRKHRTLLGGLRVGHQDTVDKLEKVLSKGR